MLKALREIHNPTGPSSPPRPTLPHTDSQEALLSRASIASDNYGTQEDEAGVEETLQSKSPSEIAPQTLETEGSKNGKNGGKGKKGKKSKQLSIAWA
jgi:hypothetical protein